LGSEQNLPEFFLLRKYDRFSWLISRYKLLKLDLSTFLARNVVT